MKKPNSDVLFYLLVINNALQVSEDRVLYAETSFKTGEIVEKIAAAWNAIPEEEEQ